MANPEIGLMAGGKAEVDVANGVFRYKQGPFIKGEIPFGLVRGFYHETTRDIATLYVYHEKNAKTKKLALTVTVPDNLDRFLDALAQALPDKKADLRGVSKEEAAARLGLKHAPGSATKKTMIGLNIIVGIGAAIAVTYFAKKALYLQNAEPESVTLKQLVEAPGKYDDKKVKVTGVVLPGAGKVVTRVRKGRATKSYSGSAGFVTLDWDTKKPVQIFVHTSSESEAKHLAFLEKPEVRTIVGVFKKGGKPDKVARKEYKKAGLDISRSVGVIDYPPSAIGYWAGVAAAVVIFLIILGVSIVVVRRTRSSFSGK